MRYKSRNRRDKLKQIQTKASARTRVYRERWRVVTGTDSPEITNLLTVIG